MSIAAYNRGTAVIRRGIQSDYQQSARAQKEQRELLGRAFERIEALEKYATEANAFFVDLKFDTNVSGLVKSNLRERLDAKSSTKKLANMLEECTFAHANWVDVDRRNVIALSLACQRKAKAWKVLFEYLNPAPSFVLPFETPNHL